MQIVLAEMWSRYNVLTSFKLEMNKRGWCGRDLYVLDVQIGLLKELIRIESINVLAETLTRKTYFRLLIKIDKGIEYLPDIIQNPEKYVLYNIDKYKESWIETDNLIFTCKSGTAVFSKSQKEFGSRYIDNKYQ